MQQANLLFRQATRAVLFSALAAGVAGAQASKNVPVLSDYFAILDTLHFLGTATVPLFSVADPVLTKTNAYFADYLGHRVLAFDRHGKLIHSYGARGSGTTNLQLPYGMLQTRGGELIVNDRGNQRLQVLDTALSFKRTIAATGQNEQIHVLSGAPSRLVVQGVTACQQPMGCVITTLSESGGALQVFGAIPNDIVQFTWRSAVNPSNELLVVNMIGSHATIYADGGRILRTFDLKSPSMIHFRSEPGPDSNSSFLLQRLKTERFTKIQRISYDAGHILVQLEIVNPRHDEPRFLLDIYDENGCLRVSGIRSDGLVTRNGAIEYLISRNPNAFGSIVTRQIHLLVERLPPTCAKTADDSK